MIARAIFGDDFAGLFAYLAAARRDLDPADFTLFNIASLDTAVAELRAEARKSDRVKKPVAHLILAFKSDESPTRETMAAAVQLFLEKLDLSDHKAIAVNHSRFPTQTNHYEVHIEVCKVGPTGRVVKTLDSWSYAYVERAAASVAKELGFSIIPGRFNTLDSPVFGPAIAVRDEILPPPKTQEFRGYAAQTGAMAISEQLNADASFREDLIAARMAADWPALIDVFTTRGFSLYINGKTKGRSQRLDAGLLVVDTANPDRREALSKLSRTSDEKLSGPGLVKGGGKIDGKIFPALGLPPEGLLTVIPPKIRKLAYAKGASSQCAEKAAVEPALADRFDVAAAFARFEAAHNAARETNGCVAAERNKAISEMKEAFADRFNKIVTTAKLRRRLVNLVLGRRSEVARFINVTADLIVDHKLEQLRGERSLSFSKINKDAQMRRATVPRWIEFKAEELDRHRQDVDDRLTNSQAAPPAIPSTPVFVILSAETTNSERQRANPLVMPTTMKEMNTKLGEEKPPYQIPKTEVAYKEQNNIDDAKPTERTRPTPLVPHRGAESLDTVLKGLTPAVKTPLPVTTAVAAMTETPSARSQDPVPPPAVIKPAKGAASAKAGYFDLEAVLARTIIELSDLQNPTARDANRKFTARAMAPPLKAEIGSALRRPSEPAPMPQELSRKFVPAVAVQSAPPSAAQQGPKTLEFPFTLSPKNQILAAAYLILHPHREDVTVNRWIKVICDDIGMEIARQVRDWMIRAPEAERTALINGADPTGILRRSPAGGIAIGKPLLRRRAKMEGKNGPERE